METRDEIKKHMEESLKGCNIIDKQETPKKRYFQIFQILLNIKDGLTWVQKKQW